VWGRLPWSQYGNTGLSYDDNLFNVFRPAVPSVKRKIPALPLCKMEHLSLKMYHNTTRKNSQNRRCAPTFVIAEAQKAHFVVWKRIGFVNPMFADFVKMTLTRVSGHWLWLKSSHSLQNVTRVELPSFLSVTRFESFTPVTLPLVIDTPLKLKD